VTNPHYPNAIKVGITENPTKRLGQYNAYCPYRAFSYAFLGECVRTSPDEIEFQTLWRFEKNRIAGREWLADVTVEQVLKFIRRWKSVTPTSLAAFEARVKQEAKAEREYLERQALLKLRREKAQAFETERRAA
jgi:hypothetical protein